MGADVTSMDPHYVNLFPNNNIAEHVYEKLITLDADSRLIPGLAETWKAINPTTWEFKLRKGAKFHDGSDFTAEDVAFSIDRVGKIPDSPGPFTTYTKAIKEVHIVDPQTIRFITAAPHPQLPERHQHDLHRVQEDGDRGVNVGLQLREGDERHRAVQVRVVQARRPRRAGAERRLLGREARLGEGRPSASFPATLRASRHCSRATSTRSRTSRPPDFAKIKANTAYQTSTKTSHRIIFYHVDQFRDQSPFVFDKSGKPLDKNPLKDLRVRQAISKAIDRNAIKDRVMEGLAVPSANLVPAPMFGHNATLKPDSLRPERRKEAARRCRLSERLRDDDPRPEQPLRQRRPDHADGRADAHARRHPDQGRDDADGGLSRTRAEARVQLRDARLGRVHRRSVVAAASAPRDLHPREGLGRVRVGPLRQPEGERSARPARSPRSTTRAGRSKSRKQSGSR